MSRWTLSLLCAACSVLLAQGVEAKPSKAPQLVEVPLGVVAVGEMAVGFVPPAAANQQPVPLLLLFHGGSDSPLRMLLQFVDVARTRGFALLAVKSRAHTWDLISLIASDSSPENSWTRDPKQLPPLDEKRVNDALRRFGKQVRIDPRQIGTFGFSDGASYSLAFGAANSDKVSWVGALAPAFSLVSRGARSRGQRVYIAHGRSDRVIPIAMSLNTVCPDFVRSGWTVRYEAFRGDHEMKREVIGRMLDDWLDIASRPPRGSPVYGCRF